MNTSSQTNETGSPVHDTTRRILLACIGAGAILVEGVSTIINRLAIRGEEVDAEVKRRAEAAKQERAQTRANEVTSLNERLAGLQAELAALKSQGPGESDPLP